MAEPPRPLCPVLVGPTATGKTALVLKLARRLPIEVVSLDSRQVYRGLRLGTAQPSAAERAACPHHLIDFLEPEKRYSAQRFRADFVRLFGEIRARGAAPLLVGGAGMYLKAVSTGFFRLPEDAERLETIRGELAPLDDDAVRSRLAEADPDSARRIPAGDAYRNRRALEILALSGRTMSELAAEQRPDPALGLDFPVIRVDRPREALRARIAGRTDAMLAAGWLDEVAALREAHADTTPGLATLGYIQLVRHLRGELDLAAARDEIVLRTAQYAKRQRTWFRAVPTVGGGEPGDPAVSDLLARLVADALAARPPSSP